MPERGEGGRMFDPGELEKVNKEAGGDEVPESNPMPKEEGNDSYDDDETVPSIPAGAFEETSTGELPGEDAPEMKKAA